jgi:hypothetical protein
MIQTEPRAQVGGHLHTAATDRTNTRALALGARISVMIALALTLAGCERPRPVPTRPAPAMPEVKSTTPEEVATSALLLIRTELRAVAQKDAATAAKCRELCAGLVAKNALAKELKLYAPILGDTPIVGLAENWSAALAEYAEAFDFEKLSVPEFDEKDKMIGVYVPATTAEGRTDLRIDCVRDGANWLIGSMAFEGTATIKIPIGSITATRPAPASAASP